MKKVVSITDAVKYPFDNFKRLFNFYYVLIPILGFIALLGYCVKTIQSIMKRMDEELPEFGSFADNLRLGFPLAIILLIIAFVLFFLYFVPTLGLIVLIYFVIIAPILIMQHAQKGTIASGLDIIEATHMAATNFVDYIITYLKVLIVSVIFLIASIPIVTLIVTVPASSFSKLLLFTDFYRRAR